jgi:hypothetical protein
MAALFFAAQWITEPDDTGHGSRTEPAERASKSDAAYKKRL